MIYFVQSGLAVKIGYTKSNPMQRLESLQTGNPEKMQMLLILSGSKKDERWLHKQFKDYHARGEWFDFYNVLEEVIDVCRNILQTATGKLSKRSSKAFYEYLADLKYERHLSDLTISLVKSIEARGMLARPWMGETNGRIARSDGDDEVP